MLIIEIDGITHDTEVALANDKRHEEDLIKAGFKVIRFMDEEVLSNIAGVITAITEEIEIIEKSTVQLKHRLQFRPGTSLTLF